MNRYPFGVIGAGEMGMAITSGAVKSGIYRPEQIQLFDHSKEKLRKKQALGYKTAETSQQVYTSCDMVMLAVKPQNFDELMPELAQVQLSAKPLILSVAAGISMRYMETFLGSDCPMVRIMPNTPLMIGEGATALAKNQICTLEQMDKVKQIFDQMGITAVLDHEDQLNDIIPVNGSSPAYVYYFIEAMIRNAVKHGIDADSAKRLICHTFIGSAKLLEQSDQTPAELIDAVCSPGGTTIEAIRWMQKSKLDQIIDEASDRCLKRVYELGK